MGQIGSTTIPAGRTNSYIPSVNQFVTDDTPIASESKRNTRVIVIGSGCAGLAAAWHLHRSGLDVKLFEKEAKLGGHANTIKVDGTEVDTGFMVYNSLNYPNLVSLFEELGVEGVDTTMGFSVSADNGTFEYAAGESLSKLFATRSNLYNPSFYVMILEILRFNRLAKSFLELPESHSDRSFTAGQFLFKHRFTDYFTKRYLIPMTAAIWSSSDQGILKFPAITLFTFLNNHLLLQVTGNITWKTPAHRSQEYVSKIEAELGPSRVVTDKTVVSVTRTLATKAISAECGHKHVILVKDSNGQIEECDVIVFACHPDQALEILGDGADSMEKELLSQFQYSINDTYVHGDESLMPRSHDAWTCWNYIATDDCTGGSRPVYVTYWLNKLQSLSHSRDIFVSLNPSRAPKEAMTFARIAYSHPQYTAESVRAQRAVAANQGRNNTFFCGAWMGYGFHEDGFRSGLDVASAISGVAPVWVRRRGYDAMIPASKAALTILQQPIFQKLISRLARPFSWLLERVCQHQVQRFMKRGFVKGSLSFTSPNGSTFHVKGSEEGLDRDVVVHVKNPWTWVRVAFESDLGMAKGYLAGEWEVKGVGANYNGLTDLFLLLLDNVPNGKSSKNANFNNMIAAWIGSVVNWLSYRFTMDNSISNSRSHIHAHYDLSNDLFKAFLDTDHMMYSCGIFETEIIPRATSKLENSSKAIVPSNHRATSLFRQDSMVRFGGSLETAQARKIAALLSRLEPLGPEHTLLDIGFGWGGICIYAAEKYGCHVHGITLSEEQKALAEQRVIAKGLTHLMTFELCDYREFARIRSKNNARKFDRIVSCEMIEAVGHNHLNSFFVAVDSLLDVEGIFVMQAITMPDSRYPLYVKSADFLNTIIFPGGCCPSLSALLHAMAESSTLHLENAVNMNLHYAETLRHWRERFNKSLPRILELGFDDAFIRLWNMYLCQCEAGFEAQILNLQILTFSRTGNPNMIWKRSTDFISGGLKLLD